MTRTLLLQRWQSAATLANQCGFPSKLCYHALELFNDDVTRAGYWLFDHASNLYAKLDYYSGSSKDIDKTLHKSYMPDQVGRANQTETCS